MTRLIVTIWTILILQVSFGQSDGKFKDGKGFPSVFQNIETGEFSGTTNGLIMIENESGNELILDFQGSSMALRIERDSNEIYDVSTKSYYGKTTSGKTVVKYETYASANGIGIKMNGQWFELSAIDGACDMVIDGLKYTYKAETTMEYLIISIEKELELSNWQYIIRTEHKMEPNNIDELKAKERKIKILPNSMIVFAIKRK